MLTSIDGWIRKVYGQYGIGLSLFFIAVSPYGGTTESRTEESESADSVREYAQQLHNHMTQTGMADALGVSDAATPEASLYNLYLTNAPVAQYGATTVPQQQGFLPLNVATPTQRPAGIDYEQVLDAYLNTVERVIDEDRDYVAALIELDKIQVIAPLNRRVHYLKTKVTDAIRAELAKPKAVAARVVPVDEPVLVEKTQPIQIPAEENTGETVPEDESLGALMNNALREAEDSLLEEHVKKRAQSIAERRAYQESALDEATRDVVERLDEPVVRDIPIETEAPTRTVIDEPSFVHDVASQVFDGTESPIPPVVTPLQPVVEEKPVVTDELTQTHAAQRAYERMKEQYESPAQTHITRGKRYFRQKQYALALITFSKAREYDYEELYTSELSNLIRLSKDRLETITNE